GALRARRVRYGAIDRMRRFRPRLPGRTDGRALLGAASVRPRARMTHAARAALIAVLLVSVVHAHADMAGPGIGGGGPPPGPPAFLSKVFPPKLVMEHQHEIGLRPAQAEAIKKAMNETQQRLVDLQWRLDAESEALANLLSADHVDEAAVLAKLDTVTAIEQDVKK